jgi:HEPN domain-containing protein
MPGKESLLPLDWFDKGRRDIETIELLLAHGGDAEIMASHIEQAIEKYLKGYLLGHGWTLERIHDLPALLDEAVKHNPQFEQFRELCEVATAFYFETRYPFLVHALTKAEIEDYLAQTRALIQFILAEEGQTLDPAEEL